MSSLCLRCLQALTRAQARSSAWCPCLLSRTWSPKQGPSSFPPPLLRPLISLLGPGGGGSRKLAAPGEVRHHMTWHGMTSALLLLVLLLFVFLFSYIPGAPAPCGMPVAVPAGEGVPGRAAPEAAAAAEGRCSLPGQPGTPGGRRCPTHPCPLWPCPLPLPPLPLPPLALPPLPPPLPLLGPPSRRRRGGTPPGTPPAGEDPAAPREKQQGARGPLGVAMGQRLGPGAAAPDTRSCSGRAPC